jgi:hypothetical protein
MKLINAYFALWSKIGKGAVPICPTIRVRLTGDPFLVALQDGKTSFSLQAYVRNQCQNFSM